MGAGSRDIRYAPDRWQAHTVTPNGWRHYTGTAIAHTVAYALNSQLVYRVEAEASSLVIFTFDKLEPAELAQLIAGIQTIAMLSEPSST